MWTPCAGWTVLALATVLSASPALAQRGVPYAGTDPARCPERGAEVIAYEVRAGDTCALVARRLFGDRDHADILHRYNPEMGPTPHRLTSGTHLCVPREVPAGTAVTVATPPASPARRAPPAEITALRQQVRARPPEAPDWSAARLGQDIERGARVEVRTRAFAELTFEDRSIVTLRGDTLVVVYGDATATRAAGSTARLEQGSLRSRIGELRGGARIETPSAQVSLAAGSAITSVDPERTTRVSNHEGAAAEVRDGEGARPVRVAAGQGSEVRQGSPPSRPRPLPAAPRWAAAQPAIFMAVSGASTVRGAWEPVEGARTYRIELARRANGDGLVAALEVPSEVTRFELHRLPPGTYYARLATIDAGFFESAPSRAWALEIVLGALEPRDAALGALAPLEAGEAHGEPASVALWPGTRVAPPEGIRCGDEEARTLRAPGPVNLACTDAQGRAVGLFAAHVVAPSLALATDQEVRVPRGARARRTLVTLDAAVLPASAEVRGSAGFEVRSATRRADGFEVELSIASDAPSEGALTLVLPDGSGEARELARLTLLAVDAGAPEVASSASETEERPETDAPPEPRADMALPPLRTQAFGTLLSPSFVGLRHARAGGVGAWLAVAAAGAADGGDTRARASMGARAGFFERALQVELATSYDFHGPFTRTASRGSGDLYLAAAWAPALEGLELAVELAAYFPTQPGDGGLGVTRLAPSLHLAHPFLERFLFRTRQGLFADLGSTGSAAWTSAYGVDVRVIGPLAVGAELGFTLGQEDADLLALGAVGGHVSLASPHFVLSIAGRAGLPDQAAEALGPWSVLVSATVESDPLGGATR